MQLDTQFDAFLQRRKKLITAWRLVGPLALSGLTVLFVWLYFKVPLLANPFEAAERLGSGAIDESTLATMSLLLPVMVSLCFFVLVAIILFVYAMISNEKRYIKAIDQLAGKD